MGRNALIVDIVTPKKDATVAGHCSAAAGTSINRIQPLFIKGGNNSRSPSDDLFGRTNAELTALIAAPSVPSAVSMYSRKHQHEKNPHKLLPRPSSLSARSAREWESPQTASSTFPGGGAQRNEYFKAE